MDKRPPCHAKALSTTYEKRIRCDMCIHIDTAWYFRSESEYSCAVETIGHFDECIITIHYGSNLCFLFRLRPNRMNRLLRRLQRSRRWICQMRYGAFGLCLLPCDVEDNTIDRSARQQQDNSKTTIKRSTSVHSCRKCNTLMQAYD